MTLEACAEIVRRGDPDRFLAAMAAPPVARTVLFPLYAFNVEVSRAPWMTAEPMIAEMRLQWWRDVLEEIRAGGNVRRHEVAQPLSTAVDAEGAQILDALVAARRADIERAPFADGAALEGYLDATGSGLAWAAAHALGSRTETAVRDVAWGGALANYLAGVPELVARSREPLPSGTDLVGLATEGLARIERGARAADRAAGPALLFAWRARWRLTKVRRDPSVVNSNGLVSSEFGRRSRLLLAALRGRV